MCKRCNKALCENELLAQTILWKHRRLPDHVVQACPSQNLSAASLQDLCGEKLEARESKQMLMLPNNNHLFCKYSDQDKNLQELDLYIHFLLTISVQSKKQLYRKESFLHKTLGFQID